VQVVDTTGTYVSRALRSGDVALQTPLASLPLDTPCCHLEPVKGQQHTYKSILVLDGDDLVLRTSPIYSPCHRIRIHAVAAR
jgi:hypothetical protein